MPQKSANNLKNQKEIGLTRQLTRPRLSSGYAA